MNNITASDFAVQGEADFKAGKYQAAASNFRHVMVDDPTNAGVMMLLGHTAFALGQYNEAAGATEMAMKGLPQDKWGAVIANYTQLYGKTQDYTDQLRALEKARNEKQDDPAIRFLLGYNYYYLGHTKEAFRELDKAITLEPKDPFARTLRNLAAQKLGVPASEAPPGTPDQGGPILPGAARRWAAITSGQDAHARLPARDAHARSSANQEAWAVFCPAVFRLRSGSRSCRLAAVVRPIGGGAADSKRRWKRSER